MDAIKKALTSTESLSHYNPQLPVSLACDASSVGVEAVIFHTLPDGTEKVVAYASCKLSPAEKKYTQIQREALSIVCKPFPLSKKSTNICWVESSVY